MQFKYGNRGNNKIEQHFFWKESPDLPKYYLPYNDGSNFYAKRAVSSIGGTYF